MITPLQVLVDAGARVATGEKGCAFEILMKVSRGGQDTLFSNIMDILVTRPDEVPFHIVARDSPAHLLATVSAGVSDRVKAGLRRRDAQGRTPSHWLWAPDGLLVEHANQARQAVGGDPSSEDALARLWLGTVRVIWQAQQALQEQGAGLDIPDNDGITAMDLCLARLAAEDVVLLPGHDICRRVSAYQSDLGMAVDTPPAASSPPSSLRF